MHATRICRKIPETILSDPVGERDPRNSVIGLLVADGKIAVDDPVSRFVPGWAEGRRGRVTVSHLLTMTSGLSQAGLPNRGVGFAADRNAYVLGLEPASEPGTRWEYSNEGVQLLSPVLEKAAGVPLQDYARDRRFRPLRDGRDKVAARREGPRLDVCGRREGLMDPLQRVGYFSGRVTHMNRNRADLRRCLRRRSAVMNGSPGGSHGIARRSEFRPKSCWPCVKAFA